MVWCRYNIYFIVRYNDEKRYINHKKSVRNMYGDKWNGYDKIKIRYFKIEL